MFIFSEDLKLTAVLSTEAAVFIPLHPIRIRLLLRTADGNIDAAFCNKNMMKGNFSFGQV